MRGFVYAYLDETDVGGLLTEALTADVQAVLADETGGVGANAAVEEKNRQPDVLFDCVIPSLVCAHDSIILLFLSSGPQACDGNRRV